LIIPGEGGWDLAVSQRLLRGRLYREDFAQGQLLCVLGGESTVSVEDDVDDVLRVLEILSPRLVTLVIVILVLSLSGLGKGWSVV
jgi:hypothetical protein